MNTIIAAFRAEFEPIIQTLPQVPTFPCGPGSLKRYTSFHLLRTGRGSAKAVESLKIYFNQFTPKKVVLIGFAGALNPSIQPDTLWQIRKIISASKNESLELPLSKDFKDLPQASLLTVAEAVTNNFQKEAYWHRFKADLVDMEAFELGQICQQHGIEFGVIKGVTDQANDRAQMDFKKNYRSIALKIFESLQPLIKI